jgi:NAD(P)H-hydrate epimerase
MKKIPTLTAQQMARVDQLMIKKYGISILQMMEHDGIALTLLAKDILRTLRAKRIVIAFGSGGNGGGALAAARLLHNAGADISLITVTTVSQLKAEPRQQFASARKFGLPVRSPSRLLLDRSDLIIDGLLGYSISGKPRLALARLINLINQSSTPVLANDLPSGLDPTTGTVYQPAIKADYTLTIALPKKGLLVPTARQVVGKLYLADIGVPPQLYQQLKIRLVDPFHGKPYIPL